MTGPMSSHSLLLNGAWLLTLLLPFVMASSPYDGGKTHVRSAAIVISNRLLQVDEQQDSTTTATPTTFSTGDEPTDAPSATAAAIDEVERNNVCLQDTQALLSSATVLQTAGSAYASSMEMTNLDTETTTNEEEEEDTAAVKPRLGFPAEAVAAYQQTCSEEGGYWSYLEDANYLCRSASTEEEQLVEMYGMGNCLANTAECQEMEPFDWAETVWEKVELQCRNNDDVTSQPSDETVDGEEAPAPGTSGQDGEEAQSEGPTTQTPTEPPQEEGEEGEEMTEGSDPAYAFLSSEDAACMDASEQLAAKSPDLQTVAEVYQQSIVMDGLDNPTNGMTMSFDDDATAAMQQACDAAGGYWSVITDEDFVCDMMGLIEQNLSVINFGSCLGDTEECKNMDIAHMLESVWVMMGLVCRGSDDDDLVFAGGDEMGGDDIFIGDDNTPDIDELDLSESEMKCIEDTETMATENPEIATTSEAFGESMEADVDDINDMKMGFPDIAVEELRLACDDVNGYFSLVPLQYFSCNVQGFVSTLEVTNIAECFAMTDECKQMNPLRLMESVWQSMGLRCTEIEEGDSDGDESPNPTNPPSTSNASGNHNNGASGEDAEVSAIGLTEDDVACMHDSDGFVEQSTDLSLAAKEYAQAVDMTDPTKLGFPADAAANMEKACTDNNGLWSSIDSDVVFCFIQGHDRQINVYNFGNCLSPTSHCQKMDAMVLVKAFFWEVLKFKCWTKEEHSETSSTHNNPTNQSPSGSTSGVGASQQSSTSADDDSLPGYLTAVIVLIVVVVIGFFAFFKIKGGQDRERIRQYEMTDVSELRFDNFMT
jgi:hypothetical protein